MIMKLNDIDYGYQCVPFVAMRVYGDAIYFFNEDGKLTTKKNPPLVNPNVDGYYYELPSFTLKLDAVLDDAEEYAISHTRIGSKFASYKAHLYKCKRTQLLENNVRRPNRDDTIDVDRFITRIESIGVEREEDNNNTRTFDFVRIRMHTMVYVDDHMTFIQKFRTDILNKALTAIASSKEFNRFGVPVNILKLDKFTYCRNSHLIELLFSLKEVPNR